MALRAEGARHASVIALALACFAIGCEDTKKPAATVADAGADDASTGPVVGGKLGAALAAAAQAPPVAAAGADAGAGGPPESGIFDPAAADAAHAPTAAPKLEVFGEGSDPKVPLSYALSPGSERKTTLLLQVRAAQNALSPLVVELAWKADKPKDGKKTDKAEGDAKAPEGQPVVVKVAGVRSLRGDLQDELKDLKDSVIRYRLQPNGIATELAIEPPKQASPAIQLVLGSLVDAVLAATTPLPDKPVGAGAYWMVTDRARSSGVDVVRYRVAKVEKLDGKRATLSLEVRQYAANSALDFPGLPKDMAVSLDRYESQGKGQLELGESAFLPEKGQIAIVMQSLLKSSEQQQPQPPGQRLVIQTETKAVLGATP